MNHLIIGNSIHRSLPSMISVIAIGFMVIFQFMYTAVIEHTREIGALYPALKAARKDPIDALSYE